MISTLTPSLTDLAERYSCDKLHFHSYMPIYERLFEKRAVRKLLEIGIGYEELMKNSTPRYVHGASLRMWADFFRDAEIYGCDIRPETMFQEGNIRTLLCDQSDKQSILKLMDRVGHDVDVVIDDGSHVFEHQLLTAKIVIPLMRPGSVYVIEDIYAVQGLYRKLWLTVKRHSLKARIHWYEFDKLPAGDSMIVIEL